LWVYHFLVMEAQVADSNVRWLDNSQYPGIIPNRARCSDDPPAGTALRRASILLTAVPPSDLNLCEQDRATLRSDLSGSQGSRRGDARRGCASGNSLRYPDGYSFPEAALDEQESDKPSLSSLVSTLLDGIETSRHFERKPFFTSLREISDFIQIHLEERGSSCYLKTIEALDRCCKDQVVMRRNSKMLTFPSLCRQRICPFCSFFKAVKLKRKLAATIARLHQPKLLTLTLKQSDAPIDFQARRIRKCFDKLRHRKFFSDACRSGFYVLEYTFNPQARTWHVHLHCVLDAKFILQKTVVEAWRKITGDSFIVDIRRCLPEHAGYLAKYVAKNGTFLPPDDQLMEYLSAVKSIRMFGSWGSLKLEEETILDMDDCEVVGLWSDIRARAECGDPEAVSIVIELAVQLGIPIPPYP